MLKLSKDEEKLHVVWIGKLPEGELENLKIWAQIYPNFEINIWIDSRYNLVPFLLKKIKFNNKKNEQYDFVKISKTQVDFYQNYNLTNKEKSFDENVRTFLIEKGWAMEEEINSWLEAAQESLIKQVNEVDLINSNKMVKIKDISKNESNIFINDQEYYSCYLWELMQDQVVVFATDLLRYQILYKLGGVYIDTDVLPQLDFDKIYNQIPLIKILLEEYGNFEVQNTQITIHKIHIHNIVINELMRLKLYPQHEINEQLTELNTKLEQMCNVNLQKEILIKIYEVLRKVSWIDYLEFKINDILLYEPFQCAFSAVLKDTKTILVPRFIIAKRNAKLFQEIKTDLIARYKTIQDKKPEDISLFFVNKFQDPTLGKRLTATKPTLIKNISVLNYIIPFLDKGRKKYQEKHSGIINQAFTFGSYNLESLNALQSSWMDNGEKNVVTKEIKVQKRRRVFTF